MLKGIKNVLIAGVVPTLVELVLVLAFEPGISAWILLQVSLFWFGCGVTVYLLDQKKRFFFSIGYTIFLNSPWYIAESIAKNKPEHLMPLVIASILQGVIIGSISKFLKK